MKKSIILMVSLLLIAIVMTGVTVAFIVDSSDTVVNQFTPTKVTTSVVETLEGNVKKSVCIENTGEADAWIRAAVVVTWQNDNGDVYSTVPVEGTDYNMVYDLENGWVEGADGFYYWTKPVSSEDGKCTTGVLIEECSYIKNAPAGYYLSVEILGSGIQSKPAKAFNVWASSGLKVNDADADPMKWTLVQQ